MKPLHQALLTISIPIFKQKFVLTQTKRPFSGRFYLLQKIKRDTFLIQYLRYGASKIVSK